MKSQDELLKEARGRNAVIIDDSQAGAGFEDEVDDTTACIGGRAGTPEQQMRYDHPDVLDAQKRAEDAKKIAEVDELTKQYLEFNIDAVRKYRFSFQQEYLDWVPGRILGIGGFLPMLQKLRPDAFVATYQVKGLRGLGFIEGGQATYGGISIMDVAPEWSQLRLDRHQNPFNLKYRGWRDVLLNCIRKGFITEAQCDSIFGKPSGPRSRPWFRQLYSIRNNSCGECHKQFCDCGYATAWDRLRADNYAFDVPDEITQGKRQEVYESRIFVP